MPAAVGYEPTPCRIASQAFTALQPEIARPLGHGGRCSVGSFVMILDPSPTTDQDQEYDHCAIVLLSCEMAMSTLVLFTLSGPKLSLIYNDILCRVH